MIRIPYHYEGRRPKRTTGRRRRAIAFGIVFTCCAALLTSIPALASTQVASRKLSPLQKGLAFYKGQTITFLVNTSVGGASDLTALAVQPYVEQYLHASMAIDVISAGNGITAQDQLASSPPTGLTIGSLNLGTDVQLLVTNQPGLNFNPGRVAWIGSNGPSSTPVLSTESSPYTTYASLEQSNPTTLSVTSGTAAVILRSLFGLTGVKANWITGYASASAVLAGFERGDGQVASISIADSGPLIAGGQAHLLAVSIIPPVGTNYRKYMLSVPTFAQLLKKYPPKSARGKRAAAAFLDYTSYGNQPTVTQAKVPADRLDAIRAAFAWTFKQPAFQNQMLIDGLSTKFEEPVVAKQHYIQVAKDADLLTCYVESTCIS